MPPWSRNILRNKILLYVSMELGFLPLAGLSLSSVPGYSFNMQFLLHASRQQIYLCLQHCFFRRQPRSNSATQNFCSCLLAPACTSLFPSPHKPFFFLSFPYDVCDKLALFLASTGQGKLRCLSEMRQQHKI